MSRAGNRRQRGSRPSTERGRVDNHCLLPANQRSPIGQGRCDCPSLIAKKREAPSGLPCSTRHPLKKAVTKDNKSLLCSRCRWRWCTSKCSQQPSQPIPSLLSSVVLERKGRDPWLERLPFALSKRRLTEHGSFNVARAQTNVR